MLSKPELITILNLKENLRNDEWVLSRITQLINVYPKVFLEVFGEDQDWHAEVRIGNKINAIKMYRQKYGSSLGEAKEAVESWMSSVGIQPQGGGGYIPR